MSMPPSLAVTWMSKRLIAAGSSVSAIGPGGGDRAVERGRQHRAAVDRDDVVGAQRGEAHLRSCRARCSGHGTWRGGGLRRASISSSTGASRPACASARRPDRASTRGNARSPNAGRRTRRRPRRCGQNGVTRCRWRACRRGEGGGGQDVPRHARSRRLRPAACRGRTAAPPACHPVAAVGKPGDEEPLRQGSGIRRA